MGDEYDLFVPEQEKLPLDVKTSSDQPFQNIKLQHISLK
jgi:hypothetical protein